MKILWLTCFAWVGCQRASAPPERPAPVDVAASGLPLITLVVSNGAGAVRTVRAELADDPEERTQGLMFRESLEPEQGMLFVFPKPALQSFWMRNTLISLDMIFIRSDGGVVGVVPRAVPQTMAPRSVGAPSQFVLEMIGGWAEHANVNTGATVSLAGDLPLSSLHAR